MLHLILANFKKKWKWANVDWGMEQPPEENHSLFARLISDFSTPYSNLTLNDEDRLYLSIFTPQTKNKTENFPVLVWIHEYSNYHGPDFFIEEEVIIAKVSFRTDILGFLNTEDEYAKGNMGAKDILMALKWVRENISYFNGDPNRVMIMGSGIASTAVASMLLSPAAEDLFKRAVIFDGSALSPADFRDSKNKVVKKIYWKLKGRKDKFNKKQLYHILANASYHELVSASHNLYDSSEVRDNQRLINSFSCSVETEAKGAFMYTHPLIQYESKLIKSNVDVIFGYTTLANLYKLQGLASKRELLNYLDYNFQYLLPFEGTPHEYGSIRYIKIRQHIKDFYFLNGTITERSLRRYAKYLSDQVIYPLLRQALLHSKISHSNVYLYRFAYHGSINVGWKTSVPNLNWTGATLGDEICYLFKCKSKTDDYKRHEASNERHFVSKIVRLLANFAKYGNPTPQLSDNILGNLQWNPLKRNKKLQVMNLGRRFRMIDVPEEKRMTFWDQLRKELLQN
ncbi:jg9080 [Pararge aegeria aegeria]|uniref:Jg9080 protein n=1 Tax=Pararge aegeria aegeria TaxID=348720 RepID=A0A8S4RU09_9NEOP|nr:jg9080 [Pararge aegeria aegeria]